jgi:hypothetical protein
MISQIRIRRSHQEHKITAFVIIDMQSIQIIIKIVHCVYNNALHNLNNNNNLIKCATHHSVTLLTTLHIQRTTLEKDIKR